MEGELVIVSLISGVFSLAAIVIMNRNWFMRQDHRLKNTLELKRLEYTHKKGMRRLNIMVPKKPSGSTGGFDIGAIGKLLGGLDDETKLNLLDSLTGQGYDIPTESGDMISNILKVVPKEVISAAAQKFLGGDKGEQQSIDFEQ